MTTTCAPDYDAATVISVTTGHQNGVLVITPCTCGDENHGFSARVYPDAFFTCTEGAQPHLEGGG